MQDAEAGSLGYRGYLQFPPPLTLTLVSWVLRSVVCLWPTGTSSGKKVAILALHSRCSTPGDCYLETVGTDSDETLHFSTLTPQAPQTVAFLGSVAIAMFWARFSKWCLVGINSGCLDLLLRVLGGHPRG